MRVHLRGLSAACLTAALGPVVLKPAGEALVLLRAQLFEHAHARHLSTRRRDLVDACPERAPGAHQLEARGRPWTLLRDRPAALLGHGRRAP